MWMNKERQLLLQKQQVVILTLRIRQVKKLFQAIPLRLQMEQQLREIMLSMTKLKTMFILEIKEASMLLILTKQRDRL